MDLQRYALVAGVEQLLLSSTSPDFAKTLAKT
jgi:hypothetical protein